VLASPEEGVEGNCYRTEKPCPYKIKQRESVPKYRKIMGIFNGIHEKV
jgi:hypothetical protein